MKKVLLISPYDHNGSISGSLVRMGALENYLEDNGTKVTIAASRKDIFNKIDYFTDMSSIFNRFVTWLHLLWLVNYKRHDFVISEFPLPLFSLWRNVHFVLHDMKVLNKKVTRSNNQVRKILLKLCIRLSKKTITVSKTQRELIIKNFGVHGSKIISSYNGFEKEQLIFMRQARKSKDRNGYCYISNYTKHKGHNDLLRAVNKSNSDANVTFIGSDLGYQDDVHSLAEKLQLKINYKKNISEVEKYRILAKCQYFVFPSHYEGFGIPLLEGFLSGCTVICTDLDVFGELLTERQAIFYPIGEVDALSEKLHCKTTKILESEYLDIEERHNWKNIFDELLREINV